MAQVTLDVSTQLDRIITELNRIRDTAKATDRTLKESGEQISENLTKATKKTEDMLTRTGQVGRRILGQLKDDFKSLLSIQALGQGLKLSDQFKNSITESVKLSDTIRSLGGVFGIASNDFARFQTQMMRGLGEVGASSEAAARAMAGLAGTPVRNREAIVGYSRTAAQLASISKQQGSEGDIAKGIAQTVLAKGGNPNDQAQMRKVAEDVLRIRGATGAGAMESLGALQRLYSAANPILRGRLAAGGGVSLAAGAVMGGEGATSFLERYLRMDQYKRSAYDALGFGSIVGKNGELNQGAISAMVRKGTSLGGGDTQAGLGFLGLSAEEANGFIRLSQAMERAGEAINGAHRATVDINKAHRETMGLGEAFQSSVNRVKSMGGGVISRGTQWLSSGLSKAGESDAGSLGVVAGGAVLAAVLTGAGLRGVGKGLGGLATSAAAEGLTGRKVQPVYVTNASEIGGGIAAPLGGLLGGLLGLKVAAGGAALAGGAYLGKVLGESDTVQKGIALTRGTTSEGFQGDVIERFLFKLDKLLDGRLTGLSSAHDSLRSQKIHVVMDDPRLKKSTIPSRGVSN